MTPAQLAAARATITAYNARRPRVKDGTVEEAGRRGRRPGARGKLRDIDRATLHALYARKLHPDRIRGAWARPLDLKTGDAHIAQTLRKLVTHGYVDTVIRCRVPSTAREVARYEERHGITYDKGQTGPAAYADRVRLGNRLYQINARGERAIGVAWGAAITWTHHQSGATNGSETRKSREG